MNNATSTYAIDATQRYPVVAQTTCRRITVREERDSSAPAKCDLQMAQPAGAPLITLPKDMANGSVCVFVASSGRPQVFMPGDVVGEIQTVKGACTVQQIESQ